MSKYILIGAVFACYTIQADTKVVCAAEAGKTIIVINDTGDDLKVKSGQLKGRRSVPRTFIKDGGKVTWSGLKGTGWRYLKLWDKRGRPVDVRPNKFELPNNTKGIRIRLYEKSGNYQAEFTAI